METVQSRGLEPPSCLPPPSGADCGSISLEPLESLQDVVKNLRLIAGFVLKLSATAPHAQSKPAKASPTCPMHSGEADGRDETADRDDCDLTVANEREAWVLESETCEDDARLSLDTSPLDTLSPWPVGVSEESQQGPVTRMAPTLQTAAVLATFPPRCDMHHRVGGDTDVDAVQTPRCGDSQRVTSGRNQGGFDRGSRHRSVEGLSPSMSIGRRNLQLHWSTEEENGAASMSSEAILQNMIHTSSFRQRVTTWLRTGSPHGNELNADQTKAVHTLSWSSRSLQFAFLLGGYAEIRGRVPKAVYRSLFLMALVLCVVSTAICIVLRVPPFETGRRSFLMVAFTVNGLHCQWFWCRYLRDSALRLFVQMCLEKHAQSGELDEFSRTAGMTGRLLIWLQMLAVSGGIVILCIPAYSDWAGTSEPLGMKAQAALVYALVMMFAVPILLPSVVASHGLFFLVNQLHTLDMSQALALINDLPQHTNKIRSRTPSWVRNTSVGTESSAGEFGQHVSNTDLTFWISQCCKIAEGSQRRLDYSCKKWEWLWTCTTAYTFIVLVVALAELDSHLRRGIVVTLKDPNFLNHFLYDVWHGLAGMLVLLATLVTPAKVTRSYIHTPRKFLHAIRALGASVTEAAHGGMYLQLGVRGFHVKEKVITPAEVMTFVTAMTIAVPLYLALRVAEMFD